MEAFSISSACWAQLSRFHSGSACIIKSCISEKVPALCRMNKLWWQIGCEWELGQNDSVQYDSALSLSSPFPSLSHTNTLTPLKLPKLPFPTFRRSACSGLPLILLQHTNWATVMIRSHYKSGFSVFLRSSPTHTHKTVTVRVSTFSKGGMNPAALVQNWTLPREFNSSLSVSRLFGAVWLRSGDVSWPAVTPGASTLNHCHSCTNWTQIKNRPVFLVMSLTRW